MIVRPASSMRQLDPRDDLAWDETIRSFSNATIFHGQAWARVLAQTYHFRPRYFASAIDSSPALLPLMEASSPLTGRRGVSLPFTDECAILGADLKSKCAIFHHVVGEARRLDWKYCEIRGGVNPFDSLAASTKFHGHQLSLDGASSRELFARLAPSTRRAIRKAENHGVDVEFDGTMSAMKLFYDLLCLTRRRHGNPPQPFRFFQNIQREIMASNQGCIALARSAGQVVAGAVFFHFGRHAVYKFGASDSDSWQVSPNNMVMWRAIERYAEGGFKVLNFGRTSLGNEGLRRFKLGWGTVEYPIDYFKFDTHSVGFRPLRRDNSTGWHNRLFQAAPIPVLRGLGALFYRHLT
jgi:hypothetical protein